MTGNSLSNNAEIRGYILHMSDQVKTRKNIFSKHCVMCVGISVCVSWRQVYRWVSKFKTSQTYLKDRQRIGVPRSASTAAIQILAAFYREQFLQF